MMHTAAVTATATGRPAMRRAVALAALVLAGGLMTAHPALAGPTYVALANTYDFRAQNGIPVSATTDFYCGWDQTDALQVVQHELLHAIGFSTSYSRFLSSVNADRTSFTAVKTQNGNPQYVVSADIVDLTLGGGVHLDPAGSWRIKPVGSGATTGPNSADMMVGELQPGKALSALDRAMLDALYDWSDLGLDIHVNFQNWSGTTARVTQGTESVTSHFGGPQGDAAHGFTWTVRFVAPEPGMPALLGTALGLLCLVRRRRAGAGPAT